MVHISWWDAASFAAWLGGRLPTEYEWETAARAGSSTRYPWGDDLLVDGQWGCNIWQGTFPVTNTRADGYRGTSPVTAFSPNAWGLHDVLGNVWEWCGTPWSSAQDDRRVIRGGSHMCHESYCNRYRLSARTSNTRSSTTGHMGFRVVRDLQQIGGP